MNRTEHWNQVYQTSPPDDVSWFQTRPTISLRLVEACGVGKGDGIIDVGGGASVLVDFLLDAGYSRLAVLDISAAALDYAKRRLGARADAVYWFAADVTTFVPTRQFGLWHDRAVFHFLTDKADRQKYVETMKRTLTPEGHAIFATFATDGPEKCSGLSVRRYDATAICAELGAEFQLLEQVKETHVTPWKTEQRFSYFRFARRETESR
ncbi:MAG: class I SAM-dependent methyltransferase [Verrucomicrobia bacterium]|nr:class I SAM-dependent methyltransferase [Verrucomicrobiota bacterium]